MTAIDDDDAAHHEAFMGAVKRFPGLSAAEFDGAWKAAMESSEPDPLAESIVALQEWMRKKIRGET
jgi:hypothetical protein